MYACGQASRNALSAGKVRIKSPIAPPRITRMRFILLCRGRCPQRQPFSPTARLGGHYILISRKREGQNRAAINERDRMQKTPPQNAARAPVDLVTQNVRDGNPKKSKRAHSEKFVDEAQNENITNRHGNEERPPESCEFSHFDRRQQPKGPDKSDGQENDTSETRARKALRDTCELRFEQSGQTNQNKKCARDDSRGLQGEMVNHVRSGEFVLWQM